MPNKMNSNMKPKPLVKPALPAKASASARPAAPTKPAAAGSSSAPSSKANATAAARSHGQQGAAMRALHAKVPEGARPRGREGGAVRHTATEAARTPRSPIARTPVVRPPNTSRRAPARKGKSGY